jgi:hypothetical protein
MRKLSFLVMCVAVIGGLWVRSGGDLGELQRQIPEILNSDLGPVEPIRELVLGDYDPEAPVPGLAPTTETSGAKRMAAPVPKPVNKLDDPDEGAASSALSAVQDAINTPGVAAEVDRLALTSLNPERTQQLIAHMRSQNMPDLTILLGLRQYLASEETNAGTDAPAQSTTGSGAANAPARTRIFKTAPTHD